MKNFLKIFFVLIMALIWIGSSLSSCYSGDLPGDLDSKWDRLQKKMQEKYENRQEHMDEQWVRAQAAFQEKWDKKNLQILQKWDTAARSTHKDWVSYTPDFKARSRVDFENGKVVFEVVIPESVTDHIGRAKKEIKALGEKILAQKDETGTPILGGQIKTRKGKSVDESNKKTFMEQEVLPRVKPSDNVFTPQDGTKRRIYQVRMDLVPGHIHVRAKRYLSLVRDHAARNDLSPQLILAVIHTESYFNPRAVSSCKAVGLMQIIPRFAGREAHQYLYSEDVVQDHTYYFDPEKNIQAGTTYLFLLKTRYFKDITNIEKNWYVSICGYNWGPTAMRKKITGRYPLNEMTARQVYDLLQQKTPEETKNYVKRVITRMSIYDPYFKIEK